MKLQKWIAFLTSASLLAAAGCTPAASDGGASAASSGNAAASNSQFESLEAIKVSDFKSSPVITDFIPEEVNLDGTKADGSKWKIAWCNSDESDESMAYMSKVMKDVEAQYGFELISFDAQSDPQKQTDHVNNAISQGCDAIIVNPIDPSAVVPALKKAKEAGLVVIDLQNRVTDTSVYDCYVGPNDISAGQQAASMVMELLPDGGKIVMVDGMAGTTCQINRTAGFRGVLQNYPQYEILEEQCSPWSSAECMNIMESYLSKYPEIDAVFGQYDLGTLAAIQATENQGRSDDMIFVSVDGQQDALDTIATGGCFKGTSMQDFTANSTIQTMAALAYLNGDGDKVAKETETPNICIEQDNAGNFEAGW